ncbi:hypothetical protein AVEN_270210-1 [Araneus ventricosus]|uniref:Uncharacterized protein n=1 Tax=Araneus ventricosus TaxID=182803 RepID=A0A4Y2G0N7_ARAVE|nr:hypothetical protein AVEN_270210-1 [Araneus ventricosus]
MKFLLQRQGFTSRIDTTISMSECPEFLPVGIFDDHGVRCARNIGHVSHRQDRGFCTQFKTSMNPCSDVVNMYCGWLNEFRTSSLISTCFLNKDMLAPLSISFFLLFLQLPSASVSIALLLSPIAYLENNSKVNLVLP